MATAAEIQAFQERKRANNLAKRGLAWARIEAWAMVNKSKVPFGDLYHEAQAALGEAAVSFDESRGTSWQAYARTCIKGKLCNYLRDKHRMVRLPRPVSVMYMRYHRLVKDKPHKSMGEYAKMLGIDKVELLTVVQDASLFPPPTPDEFTRDEIEADFEMSDHAALVERVISEGVSRVSRQSGEQYDVCLASFYRSLRTLLENHELSTTDI